MDATYWGRSFGVIIMKDAIEGDILWYKFITKKETLADYKEGIEWIVSRGCEVQAIIADGFKGLRQLFPQFKFQLCQFHQVQLVRLKLTNHPKFQPSIELLDIAKMLCHTDKASFIGALIEWHQRWSAFLKERSIGDDGKTHYTHKNLRSAFLSFKNNLPWVWTWYDFPELKIPNTNNALEALNADLKQKLNLHKGISLERRKIFIQDYLKHHNPIR